MPARRATASRWITALVDPPSATSTAAAFAMPALVTIREGRRSPPAAATAIRPASVPARSRSPLAAGAVAVPAGLSPRASAMQAMVEAVPITMQVPPVVASADRTSMISLSSSSPARCRAHMPRQSVQAPSRWPRHELVSIGPATSCTAGTSAEIAAISWAGTVLSHPPRSTTASIGWAVISSSVSIAIRLRKSIEVGDSRISGSDIVGKTNGSPPASSTPRLTASTSWGISRWHVV